MTKIELVKIGESYEVDIIQIRRILNTLYKLDNKKFNNSTKRWVIPVQDGEEFEKLFNGIAKVEVRDGREERTSVLSFETDEENKKIYISVKSFPKVQKALDPLFSFFKTIKGRMYESAEKRWKFNIEDEQVLKDGIKKFSDDHNMIVLY
jgi:hypothetical protein